MKKILPFIKEPIVRSYQFHAFPLGILFQHVKFIDYFVSDYLNIRYNITDNAHMVDFSINYLNSNPSNCDRELFMKNSIQYSNKSILNYLCDDFIHMVISMIDLDFYVYSLMNDYYLPNRKNYYQDYGVMDCLIYGYDTDSMMLNSIGYDANGLFKEFQISYKDYFNGNLTCEGLNNLTYKGTNIITFLKINPDFNFCFNLANLRKQLYEYLNSISTNIDIARNALIVSVIDNIYDWNAHSVVYGIQVYDVVIDNILKDPQYIIIRYIRILMEHKKCMYLRLEYLLKKGYIRNNSLLSEYKIIVDNFVLIFKLSIKNNFRFSELNINRITILITISIDKERTLLSDVLNTLNAINT